MGFETKRDEKRISILFRIPLIRHVRAIIELLIMFFWRNYFGKGDFVHPVEEELELIYHIWSGKDKKRRDYIKKELYHT